MPIREQPLPLKILINICGPLGVGLALLGYVNATLGLIFLVGSILYVGWELYPRAIAFVRSRRLLSLPVFLGVGLAIGLCAWFLAAKVASTANSVPEAPKSILTSSALATNITYPDGTKFAGIEWKKEYGQLNLDIGNSQEDAIQNIDLTLQTQKGSVFDIKEQNGIPGIQLHKINDAPNLSLTLQGKDGTNSTVTTRDMLSLAGANWPSHKWKLFCARLSGKTQISLVLATSADKITGADPTSIRIFGTYEVLPSEGSKVVKVDFTTAVNR